jgi:cytochrome d ubiquinol oxidase subunit II
LLVAAASVAFFFALRHKRTYWPFLIALALFALGLAGLGISMYPYVVPRAITLWDAAAPSSSLEFMLVGAVVMVPIILAYTGYAYWIFRGKTGSEGYH